MTIITITRNAKCKDCKYCEWFYPPKKDGTTSKLKRHICSNLESSRYGAKNSGKTITQNDLVCDKWKL
jgi:hypothetical protein